MTARIPRGYRERLRLFEQAGGKCHICGQQIDAGQAWELEFDHIVPHAIGGEDGGSNLAPAHRKCHAIKTSSDITAIAKTKRIAAKHRGAYVSANPMPGGRRSKWKKKMDGTVERR